MALDTQHFVRCLDTLESSLEFLQSSEEGSIQHEVYRNAVIKGFELSLETGGSLLRKGLKTFLVNPGSVDSLNFKDVLRHGVRHGLLEMGAVERWFQYRDNRNDTAHDYGVEFAEKTLEILPQFLTDARALETTLKAI